MSFKVENLTYAVDGGGGICGTSGSSGKISGELTLKGYKDAAHTQRVGIWVE